MTEKTNLLYEGKAKSVYETDNDNLVIVEFRDDMTAGDGARKETMAGKGYYNSIITIKFRFEYFFSCHAYFIVWVDIKKHIIYTLHF